MTTVRIDLPDALAKEARRSGLLSRRKVAALLREAIRSQARERLRAATEPIRASQPPMTDEEVREYVEEIITEVRAQK